MEFEILSGRDFTLADGYVWTGNNSTVNVIINEAMVKKLELQDALGQTFRQIGGDSFSMLNLNIVGVVKDFHFQSLHKKIEAVVLVYNMNYPESLIVSMEPGNIHSSLLFLNKKWRALFPDKPFHYSFLSEQFEKKHETEIRWMRIILTSALLCIFITCSGLFGMSLLMTEQRTKEIGIRKVLGASISKILTLLAQDMVLWFILALFVAFPIAWYAMHKWLQNFAYKIELTIWPFLLAGVAALAIALLTISWQTIRAATANPVEALRYE